MKLKKQFKSELKILLNAKDKNFSKKLVIKMKKYNITHEECYEIWEQIEKEMFGFSIDELLKKIPIREFSVDEMIKEANNQYKFGDGKNKIFWKEMIELWKKLKKMKKEIK